MMIFSNIKCKICQNKNFKFNDEIKDSNIILQNKECNHFLFFISIKIKKSNFEQYTIGLKCKNCQDMHIQTFKGKLKEAYEYKCLNCGFGSISFSYRLSYENEKIYKTPEYIHKKSIDNDNNEKKINIHFVYQSKKYNMVFNPNDKLADKYNDIREKINFPYGKKLLFNYNEVDMNKTIEENKIINGMKILISD